jgi:hypothetical protein
MANNENRVHVIHYHTTGNTSPNSDNIMMGEIALSLSGGSEAIYTKNNSGETITIGTNIKKLAKLNTNNTFMGVNTFMEVNNFRNDINLYSDNLGVKPFLIKNESSALNVEFSNRRLLALGSNLLTLYVNTNISGNASITGSTSISGNTSITGTCTSTGGFYDTSDKRLKKFDGDIDVNLDDIKNIQKFLFHFKNDETKKEHIGVYAQEIQKYYPQLVNKDENGYLTVDYSKLSVIALKAIDKLDEKNCILEEKINELEKTINDIKEKIS